MRKFSGHFFLSLCEKNWCGLKNGDEFGEGFIEKKKGCVKGLLWWWLLLVVCVCSVKTWG